MIKKTLVTLALLSASANVLAAPYIGGGIGKVDVDLPGFDDPNGFELIIGNEINPNFAVEASIVDFGEASDGIVPEWLVTINSIAFGALLKAPVSENADFFFKFGLHLWDAELNQDGFGLLAEDDGSDIFYGFGATFHVQENFSMGVRYNSYDVDGDDATMFSVNGQISF